MRCVNAIISRLLGLTVAAALTGCAVADFTPYQGAQQNWPTARGAFVSTQYAVPAYHGYPARPYIVLGYLDATTAPIRQRGVVEFAARRAKEIGGDAIIVMGTEPSTLVLIHRAVRSRPVTTAATSVARQLAETFTAKVMVD